MRTLRVFCLFVTCLHAVDTLVPAKLLKKCYKNEFYLPTSFKDAFDFCKMCYRCQPVGRISRRNMMPLNPILKIDLFNVWGINLWAHFLIHLETNTDWLLWIMYPNGLKPFQAKLMTTKLPSSFEREHILTLRNPSSYHQ